MLANDVVVVPRRRGGSAAEGGEEDASEEQAGSSGTPARKRAGSIAGPDISTEGGCPTLSGFSVECAPERDCHTVDRCCRLLLLAGCSDTFVPLSCRRVEAFDAALAILAARFRFTVRLARDKWLDFCFGPIFLYSNELIWLSIKALAILDLGRQHKDVVL